MKSLLQALALTCLWASSLIAQDFQLALSAVERDYQQALVSAPVPASFPKSGHLKSASGSSLDFQVSPDGLLHFTLPSLSKGETTIFTAFPARPQPLASAQLKDGKIILRSDGKTVLHYQGEPGSLPRPDIKPIYKRGGYLHPILSPSGKLITDDFPANHIHHHGIWAPWTKTEFQKRKPDFWNMGDGTGKVEFVGFGDHWSGPVLAGFSARHRFVDLSAPEPVAALNEQWTVSAFRVPGADYFLFDLVITQTCASASALKLPKYHYGGLGFRGNWVWNGAANCHFLSSTGETNRLQGNETRANWCHISGSVQGGLTGIAILCHPDNFRAPQPMRLHPTEPFFCFAPSQVGDWTIEPGRPYVARYRFIVQDGPPRKQELDRLWADYATPPQVKISQR